MLCPQLHSRSSTAELSPQLASYLRAPEPEVKLLSVHPGHAVKKAEQRDKEMRGRLAEWAGRWKTASQQQEGGEVPRQHQLL